MTQKRKAYIDSKVDSFRREDEHSVQKYYVCYFDGKENYEIDIDMLDWLESKSDETDKHIASLMSM